MWQVSPTYTGMGPEGVQGASGKPPGRLRRGETLCDTWKARKALFLPATRNLFLVESPMRSKGPKVSKGRPESPLVASAEAKAFVIRKRKVGPFPACRKEGVSCERFRPLTKGWAPKGSRGRPESSLVASAEAKSFVIREKKGRPFSCLPQAVCFLWEVSSACGRTRYFPSLESTQRVPGAAKGCMEHGRPRTPRC